MDSRILNIELKTSLSALSDLAFPRRCVVCGSLLNVYEKDICLCCESDIPYTHFENLAHNPMADEYNARINSWLERHIPYSYACALFHYDTESEYGSMTRSLKYHRNIRAGRHFATLLAGKLASSSLYSDVDLIVPVPLHWTRRFKRGFNQAEVIARQISKILDVPMEDGMVRRVRRTHTQTALNEQQKIRNVESAFAPGARAEALLRNYHPHHVLLVDDVFTTGSTLSSVHKVIDSLSDDTLRVSVATLGYTSF